jgi:hypothetical protein
MGENARLTGAQIFLISFLGVIGNIVYIHTWIDDDTDRASWLIAMIGIMLLIPLAYCMSVLDILEKRFGKIPSVLICLMYFAVNVIISGTHLNMFTELVNTFVLQYTPPMIIMIVLVMLAALFSSGKIQTLARLTGILAILGIVNYFSTFIFAFPKYINTAYIIPVFVTPVSGLLKGLYFIIGSVSDGLLLLAVFVRYMPATAISRKWVVKGMLAAAVVFSMAILIIIAMMSPELAKRIAFGGVNAARLITVGNYVQGLEVFILVAYQIIAVGKITVCLFCAWMSLKRIFNDKFPTPLLLITALSILVPSVWLSSYNKAYSIAVFMATYITLPFSILLILLSVISFMHQNKNESV